MNKHIYHLVGCVFLCFSVCNPSLVWAKLKCRFTWSLNRCQLIVMDVFGTLVALPQSRLHMAEASASANWNLPFPIHRQCSVDFKVQSQMWYAAWFVQCVLCNVHFLIEQCAACPLHCAVCSVQIALCSVHSAVCSHQCAACSVKC